MKQKFSLTFFFVLLCFTLFSQIEKPKPAPPVSKPIIKPSTSTTATTSGCARIAHFNMDTIVKLLPDYKMAVTNLDLYRQLLEGQVAAKQKVFDDKYHEYEANQAGWSETLRKNKETELQNLQTEIQAFQENAQAEYSTKQQELVDPIYNKINNAAAKVAQEKGYDYVLDSGAGTFVFANSLLDITEAVMKELGIAYPKK